MAQVRLTNVSKRYGAQKLLAVRDCTLAVEDKEFLVLVGPSGCGKTTLLRMIAGLETVTAGTIHIGDRCVNDVPPPDRDIAMVFQNYALYPHMTVYRNMAFGLIQRKFPRPEIDRRVREAATILGLTDLLDRRPKALSGGQRQRVAVGRAIVRHPSVFLFDEPLSNLDAKMRVQMRAELSRLHQRLEATMIYVTHDQVEAMTMGDRIVVMDGGVIQQIDTPMGLYERPANRFVAGFIGSPAMNFLEGRLAGDAAAPVFETEGVRLPVAEAHRAALAGRAGQPVVLGLRPEHFFHPERAGHLAGGGERLRVRAEVVEPMGAEEYVHFPLAGQALVARLEGHYPLRAGEEVDLLADMRHAHWFDPETGAALGAERTQAENGD